MPSPLGTSPEPSAGADSEAAGDSAGVLAAAMSTLNSALNAIATVLYIGAGLGPGPRDGLMTGLVARTGLSVRLVRTAIEATVLATGWLLGGTVGLGTVLYAVAIGPLVHLFLPMCTVRLSPRVSHRV